VGEFLVGGFDENEVGRSIKSKQLVVLGIEKVFDKKKILPLEELTPR
jgi:hypothetical protein